MPADFFDRALVGAMPWVPRPLIWRFSQRYIAGTTLRDAFEVVRELNAAGCTATMDVLGEDSTTTQQVDAARDLYLEALQGIQSASLDCNISVKLSEMGLRFDIAQTRRVMRELLSDARDRGNFVRIDMEDSSVTAVTLDMYRELRKDFDNVGVVLQSCLKRSAVDVDELLHGGRTNVRLCKGIYIEPEDIAYRSPDEIRESFQRLLEQLFEGGATRVGIATHDPELVTHAEKTIRRLKVSKHRYEFQMLLGVAGTLRRQLVDKGHPLRVYVPFGELWFNYSMRRLRENPDIAGHIIKNLFSAQ
ncbi:MAG: proline dehydrogenase family protein [Gammaproteobacteria bacterium]|nr:proline dehydrogenase family protein [Gammaproteobacteria bacterium]MDH4314702.1 proline dehydrogenase family protein [Gammaproteobacteria bacterium]MDH5214566.1 proline dehydrogenase family protein [Gammaproteobacteria bacterium]